MKHWGWFWFIGGVICVNIGMRPNIPHPIIFVLGLTAMIIGITWVHGGKP